MKSKSRGSAMKRLAALILAAAIMSISVTVQITSNAYAWTFQPDIEIKVNGERLEYFNDPPIIDSGTTLVAVAYVSLALGVPISWKAETREVYIDGGEIIMKIGSKDAKIGGKTVKLPTAPFISNGRTYVPLRFISEYMGCTVDWVEPTRQILINAIPEGKEEASFFERLIQTDLFYHVGTYESGWYDSWIPKEQLTDFSDEDIRSNMKWAIVAEGEDGYNCSIYIKNYDLKARQDMYPILKMMYPSGYDEVYDIMTKTLRQELWEYCTPFIGNNAGSGTFGTKYFDNREVEIVLPFDLSFLVIHVKEKGFINEEKPIPISEEETEMLTNEGVWHEDSDFARWFRKTYELEVYR